ncbi:MAG: class I SAM-dependent methyltransferase [Planctomycetota bacterium]
MIDLLWNSPTSETSMARHIEVLSLPLSAKVLDIGCGCGEFLIRLNERFGVEGTGIDISVAHIDEAKRRASTRVAESAIEFVATNAQTFSHPPESVELIACLGSTHAFGEVPDAYRNALKSLIPLVKPQGLVLIADGYMKKAATVEYRKLLGDSMPDSMTHARNVEVGTENGLTPLAAWVATDDEWDAFEWGYQRIIEKRAAESPDDPDIAAKLLRRRAWIEAYLRYGRDTLGYGTYLFKKSG